MAFVTRLDDVRADPDTQGCLILNNMLQCKTSGGALILGVHSHALMQYSIIVHPEQFTYSVRYRLSYTLDLFHGRAHIYSTLRGVVLKYGCKIPPVSVHKAVQTT